MGRASRPGVFARFVALYQELMRMFQLLRAFTPLLSDEEGQTLVEYALILILVSVAAITLLTAIGGVPASFFSTVNADF
jgi:Flp pilus assembly pilin Flp